LPELARYILETSQNKRFVTGLLVGVRTEIWVIAVKVGVKL
jgi:hypothetical protein